MPMALHLSQPFVVARCHRDTSPNILFSVFFTYEVGTRRHELVLEPDMFDFCI